LFSAQVQAITKGQERENYGSTYTDLPISEEAFPIVTSTKDTNKMHIFTKESIARYSWKFAVGLKRVSSASKMINPDDESKCETAFD
jgi:hypothetical protein